MPQVTPDPKLGDAAADLVPSSPGTAPRSRMARAIFLVGSAGLLTATATDSIAVLGRHTGFALLGSIEIVQLAVVLIASAAMIGATLEGAHASVHIFTERMRRELAARLARGAALLAGLLFLIIAAGSAWVAADLWSGHERTELLGLPLRWFRLIWILATLAIAALFVRTALARPPR